MAQKQEFVRVEGTVVKQDRSTGSFTGSDGGNVSYDFFELRVLSDEYDVAHVRFPTDGTLSIPSQGERVSISCEARAASGNVKLTARKVDSGTYGDLRQDAKTAG